MGKPLETVFPLCAAAFSNFLLISMFFHEELYSLPLKSPPPSFSFLSFAFVLFSSRFLHVQSRTNCSNLVLLTHFGKLCSWILLFIFFKVFLALRSFFFFNYRWNSDSHTCQIAFRINVLINVKIMIDPVIFTIRRDPLRFSIGEALPTKFANFPRQNSLS